MSWVYVCVCVIWCTHATKRAWRAHPRFGLFDIFKHGILSFRLFYICFITNEQNTRNNQSALSSEFYLVSPQLTQQL